MQIIRSITSPNIIFILLPWLMALLIAGTVAQRYIGLYESEKLFFASWILWIDFIPLPGIYPTLAALSLSLLAKFIFKSQWQVTNAGIIITHMGALLLLFGGLLTALTSEEGYITLAEGETKATVSDYHQRELAIMKDDQVLLSIPHIALHHGQQIHHPELPFNIDIKLYCRHCVPKPQRYVGQHHKGIATKLTIEEAPLRKEDEDNLSGVIFQVTGADEAQDGIYIAFEPTPHQPSITIGKHHFTIAMRKKQRPLPFSVTLNDFEKQVHPGTLTAREYQSNITIHERENLSIERLIRMNEPVRVQGYTLYQSSFIEAQGQEFSVLAVVKNHGRVFPYIASAVMGIGLLIHAIIRAKRHPKTNQL